jgi:O-antigen/teichoic acid export membrane protein
MSRIKRFAHSLASGYLLLGVNVIYTLASVSLALHYLSIKEFGLWAVVAQVAMNLHLLVDFGMSGSVSRILIDHKDDSNSTSYGTVIQTGFLALLVQGIVLAAIGSLTALWLPHWMKIPAEFRQIFFWLMIGQCALLGVSFAGRIFTFILQAHQRYDWCNYAQIGGFIFNLLGLWLGFKWKLGLYSLLVAAAANMIFASGLSVIMVWRLCLLPSKGRWGHANWTTFREIFSYANDIFLLSLGYMLISLSQMPVISRTLGLEAAAVWSVASKAFTFAQQLIFKILDFSSGAFAEMMVRGEHERLKFRFREVIILTGSASMAVGLAVALCNESFLKIWTHDRIFWGTKNDFLFACMMIVYANTRCHIGFAGTTKQIRAMKYIYFVEGISFVLFSLLLSKKFGLLGIMFSALLTDLAFSGTYGIYRTTIYFHVSVGEILSDWYKKPAQFFAAFLIVAVLIWFATRSLNPFAQITIDAISISSVGALLFWQLGLDKHLKDEGRKVIQKLKNRFLPA